MLKKAQFLQVFSTYVEVILLTGNDSWRFIGILHVCGGDPDSWELQDGKS